MTDLPVFSNTVETELPDGRKYMTTGVYHKDEFRIETLVIEPDGNEEVINTMRVFVIDAHVRSVSNHQAIIASKLAIATAKLQAEKRQEAALSLLREKLVGGGSTNIL